MKQTPLIKSYLEIKDEFPDCIVILRVGDFYETFFNDAKTVSNILGITLTHRNLKADNPIPLTGFPVTALGAYCKKLSDAGRDVFIFSSFAKLEEK
jgi:DNA mismatch repair protein MutS